MCVCVWLVCKRVSNSILPINNDVTWHDSIWIVHNNLRIVQLVTNLSVHTIESWRWTCQPLAICLKWVLSSWAHATEEHCSTAIQFGSLCIIMTFGRVWSKVKPTAKALKSMFVLIISRSKPILEIPQIPQFPSLQSLLVPTMLHVIVSYHGSALQHFDVEVDTCRHSSFVAGWGL